jgi:hypothetical protein
LFHIDVNDWLLEARAGACVVNVLASGKEIAFSIR